MTKGGNVFRRRFTSGGFVFSRLVMFESILCHPGGAKIAILEALSAMRAHALSEAGEGAAWPCWTAIHQWPGGGSMNSGIEITQVYSQKAPEIVKL